MQVQADPEARQGAATRQGFRLPDGRHLGVACYGSEQGRPMIYLHGGGSSRLEARYADGHARRNGLRLIAVDRPGYGLSAPLPVYGFRSVGRELLSLADQLDLRRFGVIGMSAGGPFALQLAAMAPARVRCVALINPSVDTRHADWQATPLWMRLLTRLTMSPPLMRAVLRRMTADPAKAAAKMVLKEGWSEQELQCFVASVKEGMRQEAGLAHMHAEAMMVLDRRWELEWWQVTCPVLAICGQRDPGRYFYQAMARRYPNITNMEIAGPHMPIVPGTAWDRIGALASQQIVDNAGR